MRSPTIGRAGHCFGESRRGRVDAVGTRLLGGYRDRVFAYASGGLYASGKTASDLGEEMRRYVKRGFRGVKLKVAGASLAEDEARFAAVREAVGADLRVMVDAVYALTVPDALRMARRLERYDIHFLEAPVAPANVRGMARVARSSPIPIAGNEFAYGRPGLGLRFTLPLADATLS